MKTKDPFVNQFIKMNQCKIYSYTCKGNQLNTYIIFPILTFKRKHVKMVKGPKSKLQINIFIICIEVFIIPCNSPYNSCSSNCNQITLSLTLQYSGFLYFITILI